MIIEWSVDIHPPEKYVQGRILKMYHQIILRTWPPVVFLTWLNRTIQEYDLQDGRGPIPGMIPISEGLCRWWCDSPVLGRRWGTVERRERVVLES